MIALAAGLAANDETGKNEPVYATLRNFARHFLTPSASSLVTASPLHRARLPVATQPPRRN